MHNDEMNEALPSPKDILDDMQTHTHVDTPAPADKVDTPMLEEADDESALDLPQGEEETSAAEEEAARPRVPVREYVPEIHHPNVSGNYAELKRSAVPKDPDDTVPLAPSTPGDLNNKLASYDGDALGRSDDARAWVALLDESTIPYPDGDQYIRIENRPGSTWGQELTGRKKRIMAAYKSVAPSAIQQVMSGADAVDLFFQGTGMGRTVRWPLYRSGIWVNIRPASLTYLCEIDRSLVFERAQIGMDTVGLVNSNDSLIFDEKLVDAALRLVTFANVQVASMMDLRKLIVKSDIPSLIAGMAAATFADGFPVTIPCTNIDCRHVDSFDGDTRRMSWVDTSRFSAKQIAFLDDMDTPHTVEEVMAYQASFEEMEEHTFEYKGRKFDFQVGSAERYFELGHQWISQVNLALNECLQDEKMDMAVRSRVLNSILQSEMLCRYVHYIKSIRVPAKDKDDNDIFSVITDREAINNILRHLQADDEGASDLLKAIDDYIVQTELVIFGYRNHKCSKCGNYHLDDRGEARLIIPFKVGVTFFTLLQLRLRTSGIQVATDLSTSGIRRFAQEASEQMSRALLIAAMQEELSKQQSSSEMPTT